MKLETLFYGFLIFAVAVLETIWIVSAVHLLQWCNGAFEADGKTIILVFVLMIGVMANWGVYDKLESDKKHSK